MGCQSRCVSFSLCADRQCRNGLANHSDHKFSRTLSRLFCGWLVGHVYHVRVVHRSDISRVGLVVDPWVLLVYLCRTGCELLWVSKNRLAERRPASFASMNY